MTTIFGVSRVNTKLTGVLNMRAITKLLAASAVALSVAAIAAPASATTNIIAGYDTGASTAANFDFVNTGAKSANVYTISSAASNVPGAAAVRFSFFNNPATVDFLDLPALFTLNGSVTNTAATFDGATYTQTGINGSMNFVYNGANQVLDGFNLVHGVTNLFSVNFTDAWIQGNGGVGGIDITVANGGHATFTSSIFDLSNYEQATNEYTLHLGTVNPNFDKVFTSGQALASFKAHSAGEYQSAMVPEPATWGLMILGFAGAGAMLRSQRRKLVAAL